MIIGITGTNGAGKGTVVDYLVQEKGFAHYSVRDFLVEQIEARGMPVNRDSMHMMGNEIRAQHEPSYIVQMLYARAEAAGHNALIESIRALGEAAFLKQKGGKILAVDADRHVRYERIVARASSTDHIDFDTFVVQEDKELTSTDPAAQNVLGVMQMADYTVQNDGTREELNEKIDALLGSI